MSLDENPWFDPNTGPRRTLTSGNPLLDRAILLAGPPMTRHTSIVTFMVFWTPVEILGRMNMFTTHHVLEMVIILGAFIAVLGYLIWAAAKKKPAAHKA